MGFISVYKSLQEIFPEVDARLLRAVALEHPKDADQAVEVVLTEVIPHMSKHSSSSISPSENSSPRGPSDGDGHAEEDMEPSDSLVRRRVPKSISSENPSDANATGGANNADLTSPHKNYVECLVSDEVDKSVSNDGANIDQEIYVTTERELIPMDKSQEIDVEKTATDATTIYVAENEDFDKLKNVNREDFDLNSVPQLNSWSGSSEPTENHVYEQIPSSVEGEVDVAESGQPDSGSPASDYKNASCSFNSNKDCSESGMVNIDDDSVLVSRSGQVCRVDLLEEIIEDAKNNKRTLFSAMESVINLMKEVELHEEAAEKAKEEAAKEVSHILVKVEEIKKMLVHAKEANDMHAGEVYGEKAILATEVRELHARLLSLSDERDSSLAILNEMRETLESRLASAKEVLNVALMDNLKQKEYAKKAHAEQEAFMEKVVQESKLLEQEAEENSKLQEFLVDRGRVVDMLQGEISVICQDVRLLKERFDKRIPLSQSVTSSQTTCILASSSSTSLKSVASVDQISSSKAPKKASSATSLVNGESPQSQRESPQKGGTVSLEDEVKNRHKEDDNGWDFVTEDSHKESETGFILVD